MPTKSLPDNHMESRVFSWNKLEHQYK
jgi:hypothetical protein